LRKGRCFLMERMMIAQGRDDAHARSREEPYSMWKERLRARSLEEERRRSRKDDVPKDHERKERPVLAQGRKE
jgi:hypothetical protein